MSARVMPPTILGGRARYVFERNLLVYRRGWLVIFSGFFEPIFYLFSIGIGIGALVGAIEIPGVGAIEYAAFVAPALLASSAMNGAIFESTMNIFFKLKLEKVYDAMLATPIKVRDVALGEIGWSLTRGILYSIAFLIVQFTMGLMPSLWGFMSLFVAVLIGFAFAAVGMALTTYMKSWQDFDLVNFAVLPLFLFSATFYPLSVYPPLLQWVTRISPLYHGVELMRGLSFGIFDVTMIFHTAFLAVMGTVGVYVTSRRLSTLLLK